MRAGSWPRLQGVSRSGGGWHQDSSKQPDTERERQQVNVRKGECNAMITAKSGGMCLAVGFNKI